MNLKNYIGKTFNHPARGKFVCTQFAFNLDDDSEIHISGEYIDWVKASECKRIRVVKRKKSQVLVDSLERIMALSSMGSEIYNEAEAALEKYREKTKGEK